MFGWVTGGMSVVGHIIMMYVGICFKKIDYIVVKGDNSDSVVQGEEDDVSSWVDLEANKETDVLEKELEDDPHGTLVGISREGFPIRVM